MSFIPLSVVEHFKRVNSVLRVVSLHSVNEQLK